ncbi:hypothetical protein R6258_01650 [Halomonas sp. HP20-15]|uniref:hypothetical protein n=1 Tax=Halomonas sp. HP20-15 TaxID=3085901 RepID=UPI00298126AB|nr:hypothetical protein [Halomonas sp. HP20-15]MDW5375613.1 hypothetical protein [Halomonas sp. HP20-15]
MSVSPLSSVAVLFSDDDPSVPSPLTMPRPYWWLQQWLDTQSRLLRLQLAWLDASADFAHQEAEFIKLTVQASERLSRCGFPGVNDQSPEQLMHCYHRTVNEISEAAYARLRRVSELSHDFREQIWDEI